MTAIRLRFAVTFLVLAASVAEAQAQQRPALSVGQPGALGLLWSVSNEVALRSDFSFSWSSFESPGRSESSSWTAIGGLSALFPIVRIDSLRGYFVPRISYRHMSSNGFTSLRGYSLDGGLGLRHELARRLAMFGEAGL